MSTAILVDGEDIASLSYKRLVDQIVLVGGDSDFVPAAKLARREGIDFILDPMWADIRPDLQEHIDGLLSVFKKPSPLPDENGQAASLENSASKADPPKTEGQKP